MPRKSRPFQPDGAIVVVEVGDAATNIAVISPRRGPWFRTIYRGCRSLNASLVTALGITWQQADELRQTWSCRSIAAMDRALLPGIEQLTRELRQALQFCEQALDCQISRIYLAGGGCDQFGLLREWSKAEVGVASTSANFATDVSMSAVNATTSLGS